MSNQARHRISCMYIHYSGPGSSVGIATDYGLDGPGSNPGGDQIFRPSRPALGPTQPPVKWVPGLYRGKVRPGRASDHSPPSSAAVMEQNSYTSTHPLGYTGPVTGSLYLLHILYINILNIFLYMSARIKRYFKTSKLI